jgi:U4/U6.U5 tri-snRNP component SNU23
MSMRVERSTLEEVQLRFEENKRAKEAQTQAQPSFEARVAWATEEEEAQRAARKLRKLEKKARAQRTCVCVACSRTLVTRPP